MALTKLLKRKFNPSLLKAPRQIAFLAALFIQCRRLEEQYKLQFEERPK